LRARTPLCRDRGADPRLPGASDAGLTEAPGAGNLFRSRQRVSRWCTASITAPRHRVIDRSEEPSAMHAIRKLRESGHATIADYEKLLAPNVVFHSPVLIRTIEGRAVVAKIFATSTTLREGAYTGEWKLDDRRTLLRWKGKIQGHELESFDIIEENDEGLIVDRTIAFRPMPAAKLFRDAMRAAIGSAIPDDFWEYSN